MGKNYKLEGLCVDVEYYVMGPISNNVYIISDGLGTMVVDPTCDAHEIVDALHGRKLDAIILTHFHWDHVGAASDLREMTGAKVYASNIDAPLIEKPVRGYGSKTAPPCKVDVHLCNGEEISVGNMKWKVVFTPGHTKGSICLLCIPQFGCHKDGLAVLLSGDTLFAGATGRTDFEGGSDEDMAASIKRLASLPDDVVVLPGHNALTTIGNERTSVFARFGCEA